MECLAFLLCASLAPCQDAPALRERLEGVVALAEPQERSKAVAKLIRDTTDDVDAWLQAIALPTTYEPIKTGPSLLDVELWTGAEVETGPVQVFVPEGYDDTTPTPLLMHFFGMGAQAAGSDAMWRDLANECGFLVVVPSEFTHMQGYAFTPNERQTALSALRWAKTRFHVDHRRIFASGTSRGGHLVWDVALRHPDHFAGLAPMIGGPRFATQRQQNNGRFMEHLVPVPIRCLQGAQDDEMLVLNLRVAFAQLDRWKAEDAQYIEFPDRGHGFDFDAVDWPAFFNGTEREAIPDRVILSAIEPGGRSFWLEALRLSDEVEVDFGLQLKAGRWEKMNQLQRRQAVFDQAFDKTARLDARMQRPGQFTVRMERATGARLLLDRSMFVPDRNVRVSMHGKTRRIEPTESAEVLLRNYVERLDRDYLPTVEIDLLR